MKRILLAFALVLSACNLSDPGSGVQVGNNSPTDAGNNVSMDSGGNNTSPNNVVTMDAGGEDTGGGEDAGMDACQPLECAADDCGMLDDGCGGMLDCGVCTCTDTNFDTFCPDMPCMEKNGCDANGECSYVPLSCNGVECACESGPGNCTETELRWCRDQAALTCPADACDPQPTTNADGTVSFANECVQPDGASCDFTDLCTPGVCAGTACVAQDCGVCNLGRWDCVGTTQACTDIPELGIAQADLNCNDQQLTSTFVYVDHVMGTDSSGSGSRAQPFESLNAALTAAEQRGARAVVVREDYQHNETLNVRDGISILGGFSGAPDWTNTDGRLKIFAPNPAAVVVNAVDIQTPTVLHNLDIDSDNPGGTVHTVYGVRAVRANALTLSNVYVRTARGLDGNSGSQGATGRTGTTGTTGTGANPGPPGVNPACPLANGGPGGNGGTRGGAIGQPGTQSALGAIGGIPGGPGSRGGEGADGTTIRVTNGNPGDGGTYGYMIVNDLWVPTGNGGAGTEGSPGSGGGGGGGAGGPSGAFLIGFGGGGGGGGAGGCGGRGGTGGQPGGSAFGLFSIDSTGLLIIGDSTFIGGPGGKGGDGGPGGNGGPGMLGARGAPGTNAQVGGTGGDGRQGAQGGSGGGGAGGDSVAIHCEGTQLDLTAPTLTLIVNPAGTGGGGTNRGDDGVSAPSRGCN